MRFAVPHSLSREEARRRLREKSGGLADAIPGGMAEVTATWSSEDRMELIVAVMGKSIAGAVEVADRSVTFEIALPASLSFAEGMVRGAIEDKGRKLLS